MLEKKLDDDWFGLTEIAFPGAVRALQGNVASSFYKSLKGFLCNDVAAWHHHRGVTVRGLIFRHRADEDGVELIRRREGNFCLCSGS